MSLDGIVEPSETPEIREVLKIYDHEMSERVPIEKATRNLMNSPVVLDLSRRSGLSIRYYECGFHVDGWGDTNSFDLLAEYVEKSIYDFPDEVMRCARETLTHLFKKCYQIDRKHGFFKTK